MISSTVYLSNGWVVTLRNTMRNKLRRDVLYERLVSHAEALSETEHDYRNIFCWCAGHTDEVRLAQWKPPVVTASDEELLASFNAWVDELADERIAAEWYKAIIQLSAPLAALEQRKPEDVPEETLADPNSSRAAKPSKRKSPETSGA